MSIQTIDIEINDEEKVKDLKNRIYAKIESEIGTNQFEILRITPNILAVRLNNYDTISHGYLENSIIVKFCF